jgi:integrase
MNLDMPVVVHKPSDTASLPAIVRTRGGATFDPSADVWSYRDGVTRVLIDFANTHALSAQMQHALKAVLIWYAENSSPSHLVNMYSRIQHLVRFLATNRPTLIEHITAIDLLNYKSSLTADVAWYLTNLSGFLTRWHRLALKGVTDDAFAALEALRLRGNAKGVAVMTMDPVLGPFTSIEQEQIQSALNQAFANGMVSEGSYLLAWLFMALGQRPAQYAALKVCDISAVLLDGETHYTLKVPRVKQRNAEPRSQLKERPLIPLLGKPLLEYAQRIRQQFGSLLPDPGYAPLFPMSRVRKWALGYEFHQTAELLSQNLVRTLEQLEVRSERTGDRLNISPIRFRRTFGTRAAQEGHGELVIAELLDHTDTQNVGVYVAAVPEIAARIDRAVAMQMAPLAQAFKGILIKNESEAIRGNDPSSRILDPRIDRSMKPMGSCGQHSFCSFNAPLACYTCNNFQPWLDGPHEAVLSHHLCWDD